MIHRHEYKNIVWVDLESPTTEEVREVALEFDIDTQVADELLTPTLKPHTQNFGHFLYLVLHFPTLRHSPTTPEQEVDFIIGETFIITTRYEAMPIFLEFNKVFEVNSTLDEDHFGGNAFNIFLFLAKRLYKSVEEDIDAVRETLEDIEREIFEGKEREMVIVLSHSGRNILNLKQSLDPHQEVLSSLADATNEFAGEEYAKRVRNLEDMYYRERKHIIRIWQTLTELRETNNSLLSTKQNEVMKILTIMAFVTFPLMLVTSLFGMNTNELPIVGLPHDFWIIIGIMVTATFFMFLFFKYKRWL
jgi:magnesium transporter